MKAAPPFTQILAQFRIFIASCVAVGSRHLSRYNWNGRHSFRHNRSSPFLFANGSGHNREPRRLIPANIARFTRCPLWRLSKMRAYLMVAATRRFHKTAYRPIAFPSALFFLLIAELHDKISQQPNILFLPEQDAVGWLSITPC